MLEELKAKISNSSLPRAITYDDLELITQEFFEIYCEIAKHGDSNATFPSDELLERMDCFETVHRDKLTRILNWYAGKLNIVFNAYDLDQVAMNGLGRLKLFRNNLAIH